MASQPYQLADLGTDAADFAVGTTRVMELGATAADFENVVRERVTLGLGALETGFDVVTLLLHGDELFDFGAEDAGFDVIATLPTDTRASWASVITAAQLMCHEVQPAVRTKEIRHMPYGRVTVYGRQFIIPRGNHGQAILENVLARGAHMRAIWATEWFSLGLDGPKAGDATIHQHMQGDKATGSDLVQVGFIAIKTLDLVVDGSYTATTRMLPKAGDVFGDRGVTYGIAPSRTATGLPYAGNVISAYQPYNVWHCTEVTFDEDALPGRVLVTAAWARHKKETGIVEPTDG
ncbi:MAG TPA: hypothetical protein VM243_09870 [Phycisphaerae bacterium]|nr:hypothetical protein [Phycisphaerae bacterium]